MLTRPRIVALLVMISLTGRTAYAQPFKIAPSSIQAPRSSTSPFDSGFALLAVNRWTTWHRYDGTANVSPSDSQGGRYPTFAGNAHEFRGIAPVIYRDGLVWGGKVYLDAARTMPASRHPVRVGGSTYNSSTQPGWVQGLGNTAAAVSLPHPSIRTWWSRNEVNSIDEIGASIWYERSYPDVSSSMIDAILMKAAADWTEWPVSLGAPYMERNGQAGYQPTSLEAVRYLSDRTQIDEPGIVSVNGKTPAMQTLWTVFNDLDTARSLSFASSLPIGLEVQKTVWAYRWEAGLEDAFFTRYLIINKGGVDTSGAPGEQRGSFWVDSLFIMQWSDPDIGYFADDYLGCDTVLQLAYAYNAYTDPTFDVFNLPPPAIGYLLAAGPVVPVPGESAIKNFQRIDGWKNVRMSSFLANAAGDFFTEPPAQPYDTASGRWWKILRGFVPLGNFSSSDIRYPIPNPSFDPRFVYSGDPIGRTGWTNRGSGEGFPSDQRLYLNAGPVQLAPGDTQEVVVATVAGLGADRLTSVAMLRLNAKRIRRFVDELFEAERPPVAPHVRAVALDKAVLLEWGADHVAVSATEMGSANDMYDFEGYNVLIDTRPGIDVGEMKKVLTFDRVNGVKFIVDDVVDSESAVIVRQVVQSGSDNGLKRYALITKDAFGDPLVNGQPYTFEVTAYSYTPDPNIWPRTIESSGSFVTATPGKPLDKDLMLDVGDSLTVVHEQGSGSTLVSAIVVDPTAGTGHTFEVRFDTVGGQRTWSLINRSTSQSVLVGQTNFSSIDDFAIIPGGVLLLVQDQPGIPAGPEDIFSFIVVAPLSGPEVIKQNLTRIGVFPNPFYLSSNVRLSDGGARKVTFTNLPQRATLRIYNLGGHLVRTIIKDTPSQYLEWDVTNNDKWLVASGMYLCHFEFPDLGEQRVVKLGVVQGFPVE